MKIKRWTVYDGVARSYYPRRFLFRKSAAQVRNNIVLDYTYTKYGNRLTIEQAESIKVVELY